MLKLTKLTLSLTISLFSMGSAAAGPSILFVGDSHSVGPFGWKMDSLLRTIPDSKVATYASCGSIAKWWWKGTATTCGYYFKGQDAVVDSGPKGPTPNFTAKIQQFKPNYVVVELGANYAVYPSDKFAIEDMRKMAQEIVDSGAKCFWITKPDARKNPETISRILDLTNKAVSGLCQIFDSTQVTKYPETGGDGVHYWFKAGTPIANEWAQAAFMDFSDFISAEKP